MPLDKKMPSIESQLLATYQPVERVEGSFADALRRLADRLDAGPRATRQATGAGIQPQECLDLIEAIALIASMDDVVISAVASSNTDKGLEVRFTLDGEASVIDGVTKAIENIQAKRS